MSDEELKALDYVLNYTPGERVEPVIEEEILDGLEELINREEETDNYSNKYEILSVNEDTKGEVIELIDSKFNEIYIDSIEDSLQDLFKNRPHDAFQFFHDVKDESGIKSGDQISLQLAGAPYNNLITWLNELQETGVGFHKRYLTTTDNYYERFEFRTEPFDGLNIFVETAEDIVKNHLKDLSPSETWAAYLNAYLGRKDCLNNLNEYSRSQIETALDKPQVTAKENITFLNEEVKEYLKGKFQQAIEKDTHYLTVMEFLHASSREKSFQNKQFLSFDISKIDELWNSRSDELKSYINQLHSQKGLLLVRNDEYILTEEVLSILEEIEDRSKIESYPIETLESANGILDNIFGQAEEEIKIIDRYFTRDALRLVDSNSPSNIKKRVLYSVDDLDENDVEKLKSELKEWAIDDSKYDVKSMEPLSQEGRPHDRFIIIDNYKVWQVGHSFNGLGSDFSTIFSHSEKESPRYVKLFDDLWQKGDELTW